MGLSTRRGRPAQECCLCRIIWAWADAVQAGYRLAFELGFDYVIRVDGDGQHDPRDIPKILEALEREGCEMVIGSRFVNGSGEHSGVAAGGGHRFLSRRAAADSGPSGARSHFRVRRRKSRARWPCSARVFRWNIRKSRLWWCCSASDSGSSKCRAGCGRGATGRTTITPLKSLYYMVHVLLGVFVNMLKFEGRRK